MHRLVQGMDQSGDGEVDFREFAGCLHAVVLERQKTQEPEAYVPLLGDIRLAQVDSTGAPRAGAMSMCSRLNLNYETARAATWELLDEADSSLAARAVSIWIMLLIAVSTIAFVVESYARFSVLREGESYPTFAIVEAFCVINFTVEFVLRLWASDARLQFMQQPLNVIDFMAIVPFYVEMAMQTSGGGQSAVLRSVRLVRLFRLFKVSRYLAWLKIFYDTIITSAAPLGLMVFILLIGNVLVASVLFYVEGPSGLKGGNRDFVSIPACMWYILQTATTVGFGRTTPTSTLGKLIGASTAVLGVILMAIPISVISTNFTEQYARLERRTRLLRQSGLMEQEQEQEQESRDSDTASSYAEELHQGALHGDGGRRPAGQS